MKENINGLSMADLLDKKNELLRDIKNIEESYEGLINPGNNDKIFKYSKERASLLEERKSVVDNLTSIDSRLGKISSNIRKLSSDSIDKILNAISEQRWFFFKNKPKVVFDKFTGILWANLDYFKFYNEKSERHTYSYEQAVEIVDNLQLDGFSNWSIPTANQLLYLVEDKTFPFQEGTGYRIRDLDYWFAIDGENYCIDLDDFNRGQASVYLLPCNTSLTNEEYERNVLSDNKVFSHSERLQFTLDIFINNGLEPIFDNPRITDLYMKIYVEKPQLIEEYDNVISRIGRKQENVLAASSIDYELLIQEYNLEEVNSSIIKYYKAVQKWVEKLLDTIIFFEEEKIIPGSDTNIINDVFVSDYEYEMEMEDKENLIFENRRSFLKKYTSVNMGSVKGYLLNLKKSADDIEREIANISNGFNVIEDLGKLEKRNRASFQLIAESSVNMVHEFVTKAEGYENNKRSLKTIVSIDNSWADDYKMLKLKLKSKYKNICENAGVDSYSWNIWYKNWCDRRYIVEELFLPLIEKEMQYGFKEINDGSIQIVTTIEKILNGLQLYKDNIDDFYTNERKNIYAKYSKKSNSEEKEEQQVQEKLKKIEALLKGNLENVVSRLESEDKIFLQRWISPIVKIET